MQDHLEKEPIVRGNKPANEMERDTAHLLFEHHDSVLPEELRIQDEEDPSIHLDRPQSTETEVYDTRNCVNLSLIHI